MTNAMRASQPIATAHQRTAGPTARVFLVDDHPIVREGYARLIKNQPDLDVCGGAAEASEALRRIEAERPDLVVIDISLKSGNGIELCKQIKERYPAIKMLVASAHDESLYAERVLRAGAGGYINKQESGERFILAVRQVLRGEIFLTAQMTDRILSRAIGSHGSLEHSPLESLSDREVEVFEFIGQGLTTRQIASKLNLSPKTIESYRENIKVKLNLKNSTELTCRAVQWVLQDN